MVVTVEDVDKEELRGKYRCKGLRMNADWDREDSIRIRVHFSVDIYET